MSTASPEERNTERRQQVMLGPLPPDFLRISMSSQQQQEAADRQAALALQQHYAGASSAGATANTVYQPAHVGRLQITVAQAKLVKNYGMTRMDPYVRLRVGHCVYETHTDSNGGKTPHWNKIIQCLLPQKVNSIYLEIFDECSFTMDELIAWTHIPIPKAVMGGETIDEWYPLTGKQGDNQEGQINLVLSYSPPGAMLPVFQQSPNVVMVPSATAPIYPVQPPYAPIPVYTADPTPNQPPITAEEYKMIEDMFPNMDKEVIRSVFEANRGNKEGTINCLLQMNE